MFLAGAASMTSTRRATDRRRRLPPRSSTRSGTDLELRLPALQARRATAVAAASLDTSTIRRARHGAAGESTPLRARSLRSIAALRRSHASSATVEGAPSSTYRLQLHAGFGFGDATAIVDYLAQLGVGARLRVAVLACRARAASHGYDVVDHGALNPELGDADAHAALIAATPAARDSGTSLDFVPNHIGHRLGREPWWIDVLENGPARSTPTTSTSTGSRRRMDLENKRPAPRPRRAVRRRCSRTASCRLVRDGGRFLIAYYDRRCRSRPARYRAILELALARLELPAGRPARPGAAEHRAAALGTCPARRRPPRRAQERAREKEVVKRRLGALCDASAPIADGDRRRGRGE